MMRFNTYLPIQHLDKPSKISPGGICEFFYAKKEDVFLWPQQNPQTGTFTEEVILKDGATWYRCQVIDPDRDYVEESKVGDAGPFVEMKLQGFLPDDSPLNTLTVGSMPFYEYVIVLRERNGIQRLFGSEDAGAKFSQAYDSSDLDGTRGRTLVFTYKSQFPAGIYLSAVTANGDVINPPWPGGGGPEVDPTVPQWVKAITQAQILNWNLAYSWGNHASAGYLTQVLADNRYSQLGHTHHFADLLDIPTTIAGYGITDFNPTFDARLNFWKNVPGGVGGIDPVTGKLPTNILPALATTETFTVASEAEMLALDAQRGDFAVRTDFDPARVFILAGDDPTVLANWVAVSVGGIQTINGQSGANVTLTTTNISEGTNLYWTNARGDARYPQLTGAYANPSWITSLAWSKITGTPTTLAAYGITDAVPTSRTLTVGEGLTGGGNLSANRTIGLDFSYLDDRYLSGYKQRAPVRLATTGNITLSGTQTIDGIAAAAGDRVLVKNQTTAADNGIYVVAAGAWSRSADFDQAVAGEIEQGSQIFVQEGTANNKTGWSLSTGGTIVVGTTPLTFIQYAGANSYAAGTGLTLIGNTFSALTTTAMWNASQLQGISISGTAPSSGQLLRFSGTAWEPYTPPYISGNQTITLSGDVTGAGATAIAATIANNSVTYAKMQDVATSRLLGRYTASAGDPQEIQIGSGLSLNSTTGVLSASGTFPTSSTLNDILANGNDASTNDIDFIGDNRGIGWWNGASRRWLLRQEAAPGNNLTLYRYNDAGAATTVLGFDRATGVANFTFIPTRGGNTMWDAGNHPSGAAFTPTLTGANVLSTMSVNSAGHITALTTRALTLGDLNAAPESGSPNYIQNTTSVQSSSNFWISGQGVTNSNFQIRAVGSNSITGRFTLYNADATRGANFQLNADANPGLATWVHNGTTWMKRIETLAGGGQTLFYGASEGIRLVGDATYLSFYNSANSSRTGFIDMNNASGVARFYTDLANPIQIIPGGGTPAGTFNTDKSFTIGSVPAYGSAATTFLTHISGNIQSRTAAQVLSDIGGAPASASSNYIQNQTTSAQSASFLIGGVARIERAGTNSFEGTLALYNIGRTRGVGFQLNGDTNPGLAIWGHNGTSWQRNFDLFASGAFAFPNILEGTGSLITARKQVLMPTFSGIAGTGTGTNNSSYFAFYENNGVTRAGYVGKGSTGNNNTYLWSDIGNVQIDASTTAGAAVNIIANGNINMDASGSVNLTNATKNHLTFNTNGIGAPTLTTRSVGTKIVLHPTVGASAVDYGIGIETNHIWHSVATNNSAAGFKWYGGTTEVARLTGAGALDIASTITVGSIPALATTATTYLTHTGGLLQSRTPAQVRADIGAGTGNGSVTSVALSLPSFLTVTGSPVTTSGTLTATLASQAANTVFAVGASAGVPSFQALAAAHIPSLDASKIGSGTLAAARIGGINNVLAGGATTSTALTTGAHTINGNLIATGTASFAGGNFTVNALGQTVIAGTVSADGMITASGGITVGVGGFTMAAGAGAGKVLTSDANGVASWQPFGGNFVALGTDPAALQTGSFNIDGTARVNFLHTNSGMQSNAGITIAQPAGTAVMVTLSRVGTGAVTISTGNGSPEGVHNARKGSLFLRQDGGSGTCLYVKESDNSGSPNTTGWIAK